MYRSTYADDPSLNEIDWAACGKPNLSERIRVLLGVSEADVGSVKAIDHLSDDSGRILYMLFHYMQPVAPTAATVRGVIVDVSHADPADARVVCISFPYTPTVNVDSDTVRSLFTEGSDRIVSLSSAYEGTIIRAFYTDALTTAVGESSTVTADGRPVGGGRWLLSTHKRVDGSRSRWGPGRTFSAIFNEAWTAEGVTATLDDVLDRTKCYVFLVSAPDNRLVCTPTITRPQSAGSDGGGGTVRLVGIHQRLPDGRMQEVELAPIANPNILLPVSLSVPTTYEEMCGVIASLRWDETTGALVRTSKPAGHTGGSVSGGAVYKILAPGYEALAEMRGSESNIRIAYIRVKQTVAKGKPVGYTSTTFRNLYPDAHPLFDVIDREMEGLAEYLLRIYRYRYIVRHPVTIPDEEFRVIKMASKTRKGNSDAHVLAEIRRHILHVPPTCLYTIIKRKTNPEMLAVAFPSLDMY